MIIKNKNQIKSGDKIWIRYKGVGGSPLKSNLHFIVEHKNELCVLAEGKEIQDAMHKIDFFLNPLWEVTLYE